MIALACWLLFSQTDTPVVRDAYGVPHIQAAAAKDAWYWAGYATAEDRLWQMEQSRRLAEGRMAEVFGPKFAASDVEIAKTGYTNDELNSQFQALKPEVRDAIESYAKGVTAFMAKGPLPPQYAENGFQPQPWTPLDTTAIAVRLFQMFGKGGAGEVRNMALLGYLESRKELKGRTIDVIDDFAWQNDPAATCTIPAGDDPLAKTHPTFPAVTRAITEKHLAMLPKMSLLELLPAIRLSTHEDSRLIAERVSAPSKWGSYAVVVAGRRSATGAPLLLSAPQMGHQKPSILHEMSIKFPGVDVVGVDVPGVPGVIIGKTDRLAWALTSGVADTDDIFFSKAEPGGYEYGGKTEALQTIERLIHVKGEPDRKVVQTRTRFGPVLIANKQWIFSRRSSYWMRELQSTEAIYNLYHATTPAEIDKATQVAPMSFNFFWATPKHTGFRFVGALPIRAPGLDPRFPTPGEPQYEWKGYLSPAQAPHVIDPKSGLLANWNNKPVAWWPNFDTPVWGRIFRNSAVLAALDKKSLNEQDVELVAWTIARQEETWPYFKPFLDSVLGEGFGSSTGDPDAMERYANARVALSLFDGRLMDGSRGAAAYQAFFAALRRQIFLPTTGNFLSEDNFQLIAQPTVMWNALSGKTRVNYLGKRTLYEVVDAAIVDAGKTLADRFGPNPGDWRYAAPSIRWGDEPPVPYSNRGTMIQVIDLSTMSGRNVVPPGVAESGEHALDQVPLARSWLLKPMRSR